MSSAEARVGELIREVSGLPAGEELPDTLPLFAPGLGLDSVTAARLLERIREEVGVDVAAEDLTLDSLDTVGTLTAYVAAQGGGA